ncbi:MAG TPA: hypothetical protein PKN86_02530 [Candidatus Obscuribacter sp.]|nr:hypothetical protein [Candidatus Obscuribacter sp.]HMY54158.1 hypothetical protein [Candidatus Obscuribacter sp.]HNG76091.1 hypothetical protein [Candidatus Obscuribacter sp.]HNM48543.1 hypothetical protein [Candidatus Obscuribacter sp.]
MSKSPVQPLVFADIDDNFCHTTGKFRKYVGDESLGEACVIDPAGKALSYRSAAQTAYLNWLMDSANVVPVTGRSREKFLQVQLGFSGHAIVSFGGLILLADGTPEPGWYNIIKEAAALEADAIKALLAQAKAQAASMDSALNVTLITDEGLDLLVKVQHKEGKNDVLAAMGNGMAEYLPSGWTLHNNEGQLCAYPPFLGKEKACAYYLEHLAAPYSLLIGSGDSLTDLGFIGLCDVMVAPVNSQIFRSLDTH